MKLSEALAMVAMILGLLLGIASASTLLDCAVPPSSGGGDAPPTAERQQGLKVMVEKSDAPPAPAPASSEPPPVGAGAPIADMREVFRELSRQQPRNPAAERAFIESKIDLIRGDPRLSPDEKKAAIADLRRMLNID